MAIDDTLAQVRLPQPEEISERERDDAMGAYLMMFASLAIGLPLPLLNLVASLIYFLVNRKTSPFVAFHSLQGLLTHIPVTLLNAGVVGWLIGILVSHVGFFAPFFWYLCFTALANIAYIVWTIVAIIQSRKGRFFYMPVLGRISFARYYGPEAEARRAARQPRPTWENKPPA